MPNTVRITSPDNPHAIAAYALPVVVGMANIWKGEPPKAMAELIGAGPAMFVLVGMVVSGLAGMAGAWTAARVNEPVLSLTIEIVGVGAVGVALMFYVLTLLYVYDPANVITTIVMAGVVALGSLWRTVQALKDRRKVKRATAEARK